MCGCVSKNCETTGRNAQVRPSAIGPIDIANTREASLVMLRSPAGRSDARVVRCGRQYRRPGRSILSRGKEFRRLRRHEQAQGAGCRASRRVGKGEIFSKEMLNPKWRFCGGGELDSIPKVDGLAGRARVTGRVSMKERTSRREREQVRVSQNKARKVLRCLFRARVYNEGQAFQESGFESRRQSGLH